MSSEENRVPHPDLDRLATGVVMWREEGGKREELPSIVDKRPSLLLLYKWTL
jgi:hypothetical protein